MPLTITSAATGDAIPPTAAGGIARLAVTRLTDNGVDAAPLVRAAGLSIYQIADPQARFAVASQIALLNLAADALGDQMLGFHLAETFEPREAGLLYFVLASSATLGEALARAARYSRVGNEGIALRYLGERECCIRCDYDGVSRHSDRHQIEFWIAAFARICRRLTNRDIRPIRVSLAHPRCAASGELDRFFELPVAFAADRDEIAFARAAAELPLKDAEPYLNELLVRYCDEALAQRTRRGSSVRTAVENAIAPLLPHGRARAGEIARRLGMSPRTLSRRLAAEGVTFLTILDDMRKDLALHYLKDANLPVSQIAWLLGFQEVSAFTHGFRRWTGLTPRRMRAAYALNGSA